MYALLPKLFSELGHIFHYHAAVQKALGLIGWTYKAYGPKKTKFSALPAGWSSVLANDTSERPKGLRLMLKYFIANTLPFRRIFRQAQKESEAIVFIEHFELPHLASIAVALFFLRPRFHFWILHRYELENRKVKAGLLRLFLKWMRMKLGSEKVRCLTDSELLAQSLQKDLQCPVWVIPIPHTEVSELQVVRKEKHYQFWWPGGLIREDKGLQKVRKLLLLLNDRREIRLIAAEAARAAFGSHPQIDFIPTFLAREQYIHWMQKTDLVLLPYLGKDYSKRTSGIFVEAISLGAVPIVTKGTWMAYELDKFGLSELTFDWEEPNLIDLLCGLLTDPKVKTKLEIMQSKYRTFHCLEGFASSLQKMTAGRF